MSNSLARLEAFQKYFKLQCLLALNDKKVLKLATRPVKNSLLVLMVSPRGKKFVETIPSSMVTSDAWKVNARKVARSMIAQVYPRYCGKLPLPERGALYPPADTSIGVNE